MHILLSLFFALFLFGSPVYAAEGQFSSWLSDLKKEARGMGISDAVLSAAFEDVEPSSQVLKLDRTQPEHTIDFTRYLNNTVTPRRIEDGQDLYRENKRTLEKISKQYGVPASMILALWGMESSYGNNTGDMSVVESLATLAYDGRRAIFFRKELLAALQILENDHIEVMDFTGSWAGAMGQCQFMPSSYLAYAVDYDKDGKRDIWNTQVDVFASVANYLKGYGWDSSIGWGVPAILPTTVRGVIAEGTGHTLAEWKNKGVRFSTRAVLPPESTPMKLVYPDDDKGAAYLVTANYDVIMKWNRSQYFATAVGLLSDAIARNE